MESITDQLFTTTALGLTTLALLGLYLTTRSRPKLPADYPPGPQGRVFWGHAREIDMSHREHGPGILDRWAEEFGPVYAIKLGAYDAVVLNTPDVIRDAFVKSGDKTKGRLSHVSIMRNVVGVRGVINNENEGWKANRRAALHSMRDLGMGKKSVEGRIQEEARALAEMIEARGEEAFDPAKMLHYAVSNVICSIVYGKRFDYGDPEFVEFSEALDVLFAGGGPFSPEIYLPTWAIPGIVLMNPDFKKALKNVFKIRNYTKQIIKKHKETFDPDDIRSFIDIYLKAELEGDLAEQDAESNLRESITDLFVAGSETTSTTLRWGLLYLVHYPDVQARCQKEIAEVIGVRAPTQADKPRMTYMEATVMELLRISSIAVQGVMHRTTDDIQVGGFTIPKDVILVSNLHRVHMDAGYWGDPRVFRPERWLGADGNLVKHSAFLPFSAGPRDCLGKTLAQQELFIILVSLLQKFTFKAKDPSDPPKLAGSVGVTYCPKHYEICAVKY